MIYEYDGKEFKSIKALSKYVGINEKTITARLRKGMSMEDACLNKDMRCTYHLDDGKQKSITQICTEQSKNKDLVTNRLHYGYSLDDALNKPKKVTKQGHPIVVYGKLYNSIAMAVKSLKLESKESTIRRRLKNGMSTNDAFTFD